MAQHFQKRVSLALALSLMLGGASLAANVGRGTTGPSDGRSGRTSDVATPNTPPCIADCTDQVRKPLRKLQERCNGTVGNADDALHDCHPRRHRRSSPE